MMSDRERMDRLGKCFRNYLGKEGCMPVEGYRNQFYDGVLWAFSRLVEIYPGDDFKENKEWQKKES